MSEKVNIGVKSILSEEEIKQLEKHLDGDDYKFYGTPLYEKLLDYYASEIPYGVIKFKTGCADEWILNRVERELK